MLIDISAEDSKQTVEMLADLIENPIENIKSCAEKKMMFSSLAKDLFIAIIDHMEKESKIIWKIPIAVFRLIINELNYDNHDMTNESKLEKIMTQERWNKCFSALVPIRHKGCAALAKAFWRVVCNDDLLMQYALYIMMKLVLVLASKVILFVCLFFAIHYMYYTIIIACAET